MCKLRLMYAAWLIGILGIWTTGHAHHSFAMFDSNKSIVIEGLVREFAWRNPHAILWVTVPGKDASESKDWSVEMTSPGNLTRLSMSKRSFTPGQRVRVTIRPLRSGAPGGAFQEALIVDTGEVIKYQEDKGVVWR